MKNLKILINRMPLSALIGVNPGETDQAQPLELDIEIELDPSSVYSLGSGGRRASLDRTVDYAKLTGVVRRYVEAEARVFELLEDLGADLFTIVSHAAPRARRICVGLSKPQALGGAGIPMVLLEGAPDLGPGSGPFAIDDPE
ncbi:MAG: dihydroneopterin aldolase [Spirochaetaceae bacterium]|nr:MAG: dihydroneopterin aldolase [Spirochaetaceae bacterium]